MFDDLDGTEIAIIGMAGRFPGASDLDAFWNNLRAGVESITALTDQDLLARGVAPDALRDPYLIKAAAVLDDMELFDAGFFGFTHREAELIDPQHRVLLECAWEALERAGYATDTFDGAIGVYAGAATNTYLLFNLLSHPRLIQTFDPVQIDIASSGDFLATRISYKLNLRGPSHTIQSACSTSLVAVHAACQSLLNEECDIALAGGVAINVTHPSGYRYLEGGIVSPDGHCRAFDAHAAGTIFSSGAGMVVLRRLADALAAGDMIEAVIRGSAVNNDGAQKVGYTAPSVDGQAAVIAEALSMAGVASETIGYVEAHGTGTAMGDPIEVQALTKAFRASADANGFCALGTVKSNVGHLGAAAGVAGLIKAVLALKHRQIPPSLHFERPNPDIDFSQTPFYVNTRLAEWRANGTPRRAGVSSFGVGGTNAHVVVEEAPPLPPTTPGRPWQLLLLSAKTSAGLALATANLVEYVRQHPEADLADVAYTLQVGRQAFSFRGVLLCRDRDDAIAALEEYDLQRVLTDSPQVLDRPVAFLLPGQGAQYVGMAAGLYQHEPAFREVVDHCAELLVPQLGLDLRVVLYPDLRIEDRRWKIEDSVSSILYPLSSILDLDQTWLAQPALFVVEYALARLWMEWGVRPQALLGHSVGEYVAACLAGVFSLEDALRLVVARGKLMQQLPEGAMLAVYLSAEDAQPYLGQQLAIAAINGPALCVVAGPTEAIEQLELRLAEVSVSTRRLHTSHAFHSPMIDPIVEPFVELVRGVSLNPPQIPYISNLTGTWISAAEATDPQYWGQHLRQTVRFGEGLQELLRSPEQVLLEVGPGTTLSQLIRQQVASDHQQIVLASTRHPSEQQPDEALLLSTLGKLWLAGVRVDWPGLYRHERRRRLPLPTHPFERQRYWIEPYKGGVAREHADEADDPFAPEREERIEQPSLPGGSHARPNVRTPYVAPRNELERSVAAIWQELFGIEHVGVDDNFFELGGHSLLAAQAISRVREALGVDLLLQRLFETPTVAGLAERIAAEQREAHGLHMPPLLPIARDGDMPLSFAQQRLWFLAQLEPGNPFYTMSANVCLTGPLDIDALHQGLNRVVQRHEVLRTTFEAVEGRPIQVIGPARPLTLLIVDLRTLPDLERDAVAHQLAIDEFQRPFDLVHGPLLRATLARLDEQAHRLLLTMHHIIADGWSVGVLIRELVMLYAAHVAGQPALLADLPIQYADYAVWQRQWLQGAVLEPQLAYWRAHLADIPTLQLPTDRPRPAATSFQGACQSIVLPPTLRAELVALSRREGVTLFMTLLGAWQLLLARYSEQEDLVVGTPIAGRTRSEIEGLIGCFVNTLALRTDLSGAPTFCEVLKRVREVCLGAYAHQDLPFEQVVDAVQPARDLSRHPLFQVMFALQNTPALALELPDLTWHVLALDYGVAKFDLSLSLVETATELSGVLEYCTELFDATTIARMLGHFQTLLDGICTHAQRPLASLPLLTASERQQLLAEWNTTPTSYPQHACLHQLFAAQVERSPDAVALVFDRGQGSGVRGQEATPLPPPAGGGTEGGRVWASAALSPQSSVLSPQSLTYRELNARATRLAHQLRALGVQPEHCVGLCLERSLELVVGLLAILKAGGAYLPLDPAYPAARLAFLLQDAQVQLVLTQKSIYDLRFTIYDLEGKSPLIQNPKSKIQNPTVVCLDAEWPFSASACPSTPDAAVSAANLAYVIYTSGSTGNPKGVGVTHANVVRLFAASQAWFGFAANDVWSLFHSYAFDFSVWEVWGALLYGGRLVVLPYLLTRAPATFYALTLAERVSVLNQTPSAFRQFMQAAEQVAEQDRQAGGLSRLRLVILGGEALDFASLRRWVERCGAAMPRLINMYGITETTVHVSYRPISAEEVRVPDGSRIGRALADLQLYVLDGQMQLVPVGVAGELYIGGAGLARGYLNRPELTAERFIPNPFAQGMGDGGWGMGNESSIPHPPSPIPRLYRTGDRVRYRADGDIEYLGRLDSQVKLRGYRIELGEIAAALRQHQAVEEVEVLVREDRPGEKRLVAYVVPKIEDRGLKIEDSGSDAPDPLSSILYPLSSELRGYLQTRLPDYMVPASLVMMEALPLTAHGKLDQRALPAPDTARPQLERPFRAPRTPVEAQMAAIWHEVLGVDQIGIDDNFFALGGHSLLLTQLLARIRSAFAVDLPLRALFEAPTVVEMTIAVADLQIEQADTNAVAQFIQELDQLSPDEIATMLADAAR